MSAPNGAGEPGDAFFELALTLEEAKALHMQLGDVPQGKAGPRLRWLYRHLDARLRLVGHVDEGPVLVRVRKPPMKPSAPPLAPSARPPPGCEPCNGLGLVQGEICAACDGRGE